MAPACFDHCATSLRADRRPLGRLQETNRRTNYLMQQFVSCSVLAPVAWVSATAGAISIPHSLPTTGDQDHAHRAAKPAAGKAHAGNALTAHEQGSDRCRREA